ncbi:helix-turn-helix transcriptional regulator [Paraburkholderia jirisanensis]
MHRLLTTSAQAGQVLRSARRKKGLSQAEAAARLGLSQSRISELEKDASAITLSQLLAMAALYGLELELSIESPRSAASDEAAW